MTCITKTTSSIRLLRFRKILHDCYEIEPNDCCTPYTINIYISSISRHYIMFAIKAFVPLINHNVIASCKRTVYSGLSNKMFICMKLIHK